MSGICSSGLYRTGSNTSGVSFFGEFTSPDTGMISNEVSFGRILVFEERIHAFKNGNTLPEGGWVFPMV